MLSRDEVTQLLMSLIRKLRTKGDLEIYEAIKALKEKSLSDSDFCGE